MTSRFSLWPLALLLCAAAAHAQLYKWVGPDGKVVYSDTPPPSNAAKVERKNVSGGSPDSELPYEVAEAKKNNPVTLYTTTNCDSCNNGRKLLTTRGIPFSEKTVVTSADIEKLKAAGGSSQLPFLTIGRNKKEGFESGSWDAALTAAGYPESNRLPKTYQNAPAESAAPVVKPEPPKTADSKPAEPVRPGDKPQPTGSNVPPGFRF
jgi:glutaredoxin